MNNKYLFFILLLFFACKKSEKEIVQVDEISSAVKDLVSSAEAPEEIKKLYQYEYKIIQYPIVNYQKIEDHLNELGRNRWDCFDTDLSPGEKTQVLTVFCKRKPDTPLKYIPKTFIGGS